MSATLLAARSKRSPTKPGRRRIEPLAQPLGDKIYADAIARGCDHPHAIHILGRGWLRISWRIWQNREPYDHARHGSLQRLLATEG